MATSFVLLSTWAVGSQPARVPPSTSQPHAAPSAEERLRALEKTLGSQSERIADLERVAPKVRACAPLVYMVCSLCAKLCVIVVAYL